MHSPTHNFTYNNPNLLAQFPVSQEDMEDHFNHLLSGSVSRYTAAETQITHTNNQESFHSTRMFVISTLESWGMKLGTLPFSKDNELTVKCLLELITEKQRSTQQKIKAKQQLAAVNFEKQKYESLLKQSKVALTEKDKQLGRLENQFNQLRKKVRLIETQAKKEKAEDQKIICMLKSKNQQILHEVKKKQAEVNRVKQQMKRNVLTKSTAFGKSQTPTNSVSNAFKNGFEIIEKIERNNPSKWKKSTNEKVINQNNLDNFEEEKFSFMMEKYEREKKNISNENTILRGKVFDIREVLLKFAEWIDVELFGQNLQKTRKMLQKRFICNHNLLFSKDALMNDLIEVINEAKHGIRELQQRVQETEGGQVSSQKSLESPMKKPSSKGGNEGNGLFKKKSMSIKESNTPVTRSPLNPKSQKTITHGAESNKEIKPRQQHQNQSKFAQNQPRKGAISKTVAYPKSPQLQKQFFNQEKHSKKQFPSQIRASKQSFINQLQLSAFDNDVLSDIYEHSVTEDQENSIVSQMSASEFVKELEREEKKKGNKVEKEKYDKWDILFKTEGDEEND